MNNYNDDNALQYRNPNKFKNGKFLLYRCYACSPPKDNSNPESEMCVYCGWKFRSNYERAQRKVSGGL